ncbi:MAG: hypothetical protein BWY50_00147 [Spirochaetes bacterium ADurb.Bin315]|nr:MAG: hypothetical protein BWY50_00147 [Spirochaetes bacterium ADurb.Bin315]
MALVLKQLEEPLLIGGQAIRFQSNQFGEEVWRAGEARVHVARVHGPLTFEIGEARFYFLLAGTNPTVDLFDLPKIPMKKIQLVGGLVDQDAAALQLPRSSPRVAVVIRLVPPSEHRHLPDDRSAEISAVDRFADPLARRIPPALADHPELLVLLLRFLDHQIALPDGQGHRFFNHDVKAGIKGLKSVLHVKRVDGGHHHRIDFRLFDHLIKVRIRFDLPLLCELSGFFHVSPPDGDELSVLHTLERLSVQVRDLSVSEQCISNHDHPPMESGPL